MLAWLAVPRGRRFRAARIVAAAAFLATTAIPLLPGSAAGEESLSDLKARMESIQAELDAATARIEELRTQQDNLHHRVEELEARLKVLEERKARLQSKVVARAEELYKAGSTGMVEVLVSSETVAELMDRAELLSRASLDDTSVFIDLSRAQAELTELSAELERRSAELARTHDALEEENERLQARFRAARSDYEELQRRLAAAEAAAQAAPAAAPAESAAAPAPAPFVRRTGGMSCPVAGPVSFFYSWCVPLAGHTQQGVYMMLADCTPVFASVTVT